MVRLSLKSITTIKSLVTERSTYITGKPVNMEYFDYLLRVLNDLRDELNMLIIKTAYP